MKAGAIMILVFAGTATALADEAPHERAERAIRSGQYEQAIEAYEKVAEKLTDAPELDYNRGVAHYRKGDCDKAREFFTRALSTRDLSLEAKAKFNLGNCAYATALANQENVEEAVMQLKTAIAHYRDAIEAEPRDQDARANIEMAQLFMRHLLDQQKNRQEQQKQQEDKEQQEEQPRQEKQDQEPQRSESEEQEQPRQDSQTEQEAQDQQEQQQKQSNEKPQESQESQQSQNAESQQQQAEQQGSAGQPREPDSAPQQAHMTREQAERLLQLVRDKELQRRREQERRARVRLVPVEKDW